MLNTLDWIVLLGTLLAIVAFGIYKTRGKKSVQGYLLGGNEAKWWTIGLSVMATQASAITFLSTPGQAYAEGMGFVQFYFGQPLAMLIVCITFIPIFYRLKVYTAYEYLESRFDRKARSLAAVFFLIQRGMGAGITIYAPAIILSTILGWNLNYTILMIGLLVIVYTVSGGTKAVSQTQKVQMVVILVGMAIAFVTLINYIPDEFSLREAFHIAGASGKMQAVDTQFDLNNRYNIWSGLLGGLFLGLAYFGTDQSQVQRYISGRSIRESRLGLVFNALLKVPMQFFILLTGVLVFVFYQFHQAPIFFNAPEYEAVMETDRRADLAQLEDTYDQWFADKQALNRAYIDARRSGDEAAAATLRDQITAADERERAIRDDVRAVIEQARPDAETNDRDYVFISFILNYLPIGVIGLLLAVIFSAAMSSTAAELNALGSTSTVDLYKRTFVRDRSDGHYVKASMGLTMLWGIIAILFALFGTLFENLIQFVNIVGSLFYGTVLGMFVSAFYVKRINSTAVFIGALIAEAVVLLCFFYTDIGFLWYNVIGCLGVVVVGLLVSLVSRK
ncbi:MAG: sodium:solute symporter [Saprospiraceae bacterium]|nr:sodium:solute symporter [Saprospiraceae bacterium]